jgi:hypothetical protein
MRKLKDANNFIDRINETNDIDILFNGIYEEIRVELEAYVDGDADGDPNPLIDASNYILEKVSKLKKLNNCQ